MQKHDENDAGDVAEEDWLGGMGLGSIAALGAGVFALSILGMVALDRFAGAQGGEGPLAQITVPEVEGIPFEPPESLTAVPPPRLPDDAPAWMVNAAPFIAPADKPLMAIIVLDDGTESHAAIRALEWTAPLSFAVAADFDLSPHRVEQVRRAGREALALVPFGYGPDFGGDANVLRRGLAERELLRRLNWHLARAGEGIVGAVDRHAGDIVRDVAALRIVGDGLAASGMLMIDSRDEPGSLLLARLRPMGVPVGRRTARVLRRHTQEAALEALADAERHAWTWGTAIVLVEAGDGTMDTLDAWLATRAESVALAPVTHVIRRLRHGPQYAEN